MRGTKLNFERLFLALTITTIALAAILFAGYTGRNAASAQDAVSAAQPASVTLPAVNIYALNNDNVIFVLKPGTSDFVRLVRVGQVDGNLIGLDFRPADGNANSVYGLTDTGSLYTINLAAPTTRTAPRLGAATLVSKVSPRFAGGYQSLMDFNPVVNALRLIGSNDQNFALVNSGGNLNVTAPQTAMAYDLADVNKGVDANVGGGSYTNNFAGAPNTIFYGVDYDLDTFVTISSKNATGSSNTGGGQLQTIGKIVTANGGPLNLTATADLDIYTDANGVNSLVGVSGRRVFTIDLSQINPALPLGTTQNVIAKVVQMNEPGGGYIDIAIPTATRNSQ